MEFILIYVYHLVFVYGICRLDGKNFYIWPYAFYIILYCAVFWAYLCFVRFALNAVKKAIVKMVSSVIGLLRFVISLVKRRSASAEANADEEEEENDDDGEKSP